MMEERRKNTMILYRNLRYQQLFDDMCSLLKPEEGGARPDAYACASQLIDLAVTYGFRGNLWHCFLAFCMANNENAYSTSCEIIGPVGGSLSELARHDFAQVRELFSLDIAFPVTITFFCGTFGSKNACPRTVTHFILS